MKLYRSNRMELLAETLAEVLSTPRADPMAAETVIVQSRGMERWLSMQLADHLGVCANVEFPFPRTVIRQKLSEAMGIEKRDWEAWSPDAMMWSILSSLQEHLDTPPFAPLRRYLERSDGGSPDLAGREAVALVREIADVFDRYLTYRPEMILRWDAGEGDPEAWQPRLWASIRAQIGARHLAEIARDFINTTRRRTPTSPLGERLCVFGISTLPPLYVSLLSALSHVLDVHVFVLCPSNGYWGHIRNKREIARAMRRSPEQALSAIDLQLEEGNPLLASLGRLGRDFQVILEGLDASTPYVDSEVDLFMSDDVQSALHVVQDDILHIRHRGKAPMDELWRPSPWSQAPDDHSLSIHGCYGPMRQVEALYDYLLKQLEDDDTLEPRDVVVMTPNLTLYAPLIDAVFSQHTLGKRSLPYRLADRPLRANNDAADVVLKVLSLATSRLSSRDILDLVAVRPVRQRFSIPDDHLTMIQRWVVEADIRWGVDADHRDAWRQPKVSTHTWREGFRRLLLGAAMADREDLLIGETAPLEQVEGGSGVALGRFIDLCEAVFGLVDDLREPRALSLWAESVSRLTSTLLTFDDPDQWRAQEVVEVAQTIAGTAETAAYHAPLSLAAFRALLTKQLDQPPRASGFVTGAVTVCAMVPMRSVPFKVVCLLGMDDDAFPRHAQHIGFDLTGSRPRLGDRNPRDEDRYLLLEAFLAARQSLAIFFTGRSMRSGVALPPAVPVGEFIDVLRDSFGPKAAEAMITHYPLQPFSPKAFGLGDHGEPIEPLSYSPVFAQAAALLLSPAATPERRYVGGLPEVERASVIDLEELVSFFLHPAKHLCSQRLKLRMGHDDDKLEEREPLTLNTLGLWKLRDEGFAVHSQRRDVESARRHMTSSGLVPYGTVGDLALDKAFDAAQRLAEAVEAVAPGAATHLPVAITLGDRELKGRLSVVEGFGAVSARAGKLRPKDQLSVWIRHLALLASGRADLHQSAFITMDGASVKLGACASPEEATQRLKRLVELYDYGMEHPLAFFVRSSLTYAERSMKPRRANSKSPAEAVRSAWSIRSSFGVQSDGLDPYVEVLWGEPCPFAPDEGGPRPEHALSPEALALEIWGPYLKEVLT